MFKKYFTSLLLIFLILSLSFSVTAHDESDDPAFIKWSTTELHYQYGNLDTPEFAGGGNEDTHIVTLQHASGWKYGDNFFFVDFLDGDNPNFNNNDVYAELYTNFSLSKITGKDISFGLISDIGLIMGFNYAADPKVKKYLPGIRLSLNLPGFAFANLDMAPYIDDSKGVRGGGAPKEDDSYWIDFNWAYPFSFGNHDFSIEGHIEYIAQRDNEFNDIVKWHILAQPQFRYDLGKALFNTARQLYIGTELQWWENKLGDSATDEYVAQALVVWQF